MALRGSVATLATAPALRGGLLCAAWALALAAPASAQPTESRGGLLAEPIGYTNVADAFEEGDPLDVDVSLGYEHSESSSSIEREIVDYESSDGRSSRNFVQVARHSRSSNGLALQLDIGVYHDVMLIVRLPVVLGEDQELRPLPGQACTESNTSGGCAALREPSALGGDTPLFDLSRPLESAHRS
ncbi:MAG TPA: hypothetical protein VHM19_09395, partial [Polyangiales bacterium]|nr:hypothetical protein [Polyangiales bacterium]